MAAKKGGLGKGLDALFADNAIEEDTPAVKLKISEIEPNREQPRKEFDDAALAELADSIAQHGVLQPLLVRPLIGGGYQLVAGERRWRASRMAGLTEVPVVVRQMSDQEMMELALIENLQREDLSPMEEAEGYRTLMESYSLTQEEVAQIVGKSRPAVANSLRLLALPNEIGEMVRSGELSAGHARALLAFPQEQMLFRAKDAVAQSLTVRDIEKLAKSASVGKAAPKAPPSARRATFFDEVEIALAQQLGRRVRVTVGNGKKGRLEIEFYSPEDLQELAMKLGKE